MKTGFTQQTAPVSQNDFARMTFAVELNKNEYFPLEPIPIQFKFTNQTNKSLTTLKPRFLNESLLRVTHDGQTKEFDTLTLLNARTVSFPGVIKPNQVIQEDQTLDTNLDHFFPIPGDYQIQFLLSEGTENEARLESNVIQIRIKEPSGINLKALNFIRANKNKAEYVQMPLLWGYDKKDQSGNNLMETFVQKYGDSVYGEYVAYTLAIVYLSRKDFEKARVQLDKIKFSENRELAKNVERSLNEVKRNFNSKN